MNPHRSEVRQAEEAGRASVCNAREGAGQTVEGGETSPDAAAQTAAEFQRVQREAEDDLDKWTLGACTD